MDDAGDMGATEDGDAEVEGADDGSADGDLQPRYGRQNVRALLIAKLSDFRQFDEVVLADELCDPQELTGLYHA